MAPLLKQTRGLAQPIWPGVAPGTPMDPSAPINKISPPHHEPGDHPTLTPYLLDDEQPHPLVLVIPGGAYACQAAHEGEPIAVMLNLAGFHAAVLHYRVGPRHHHPAMLHDAQRAMRLLRIHADNWQIACGAKGQALIGAIGFSAGGHLSATLAVHWDRFLCPEDELTATVSARPDAVVLCYAVIDMDRHRHHGSLGNLMGPQVCEELIEALSCHQQVRDDSPPAFLWHTADDGGVAVHNSLLYFQACLEKQVRAELHVYESGHHGMSLAENHETIRTWAFLATAFLKRHLT